MRGKSAGNRYKRLLSVTLGIVLLLQADVSVEAAQTVSTFEEYRSGILAQTEEKQIIISVSTEEDLFQLANACRLDRWSRDKQVELENDIELREYCDLSIPSFGGTFEGNGHKISGLKLDGAGAAVGLFRYLQEGAKIRNLAVQGSIKPEGTRSQAGGIVGINYGSVSNCTFDGVVSGDTEVGGIAGSNMENGDIRKCRSDAIVTGNHSVGGIVGSNRGTVSMCKNMGNINTFSEDVSYDLEDITAERLEDINNTSNVTAHTDSGGIAGISYGKIYACANYGTVGYSHVGYNVGGIVGRLSQGYLSDCVNEGHVLGRKDVGGIAGQMEPFLEVQYLTDKLQELDRETDKLFDLIDASREDLDGYGSQAADIMKEMSTHLDAARTCGSNLLNTAEELWYIYNQELSGIGNDLDELFPGNNMQGPVLPAPTPPPQFTETSVSASVQEAGQADGSRVMRLSARPAGQTQGAVLLSVQPGLGAEKLAESEAAGEENSGNGGAGDGSDKGDSGAGGSAVDGGDGSAGGNAADDGGSGVGGSRADVDGSAGGSAADGGNSGAGGSMADVDGSAGENVAADGDGGKDGSVDRGNSNNGNSSNGNRNNGKNNSGNLGNMVTKDELESYFAALKKCGASIGRHMQRMAKAGGDRSEGLSDNLSTFNDELQLAGDELDKLTEVLDAGSDVMNTNMDAVWQQINVVHNLVKGIRDDLFAYEGITIEDASDEPAGENAGALLENEDASPEEPAEENYDTGSFQKGKIKGCRNEAVIEADTAVGGIVGQVAIEFDLDPEDDLSYTGEESLNIERKVKAVVRDNLNRGDVIGKRDYVGGIVGKADFGAIISCESYGNVSSSGGSRVGGVAGASDYAIRSCYSMGKLSGKNQVGGIVGKGCDVFYSYAYNQMELSGECGGSIAGTLSGEGTLYGNYYVENDWGGVDGIGYLDGATPLAYEEFKALQDVPEAFSRFRVTFRAEDKELAVVECGYGEALERELIPDIPEKEGFYGVWPEFAFDYITGSEVLEAEYERWLGSLVGTEKDEQGRNLILVEGEFLPGAKLETVEREEGTEIAITQPILYKGQIQEEYVDYRQPVTVRILCEDAEHAVVELEQDGAYVTADARVLGSYVVFSMDAPSVFRVTTGRNGVMIKILAAAAVVLTLGLAVLLVIRMGKRRQARAAAKNLTGEESIGETDTGSSV